MQDLSQCIISNYQIFKFHLVFEIETDNTKGQSHMLKSNKENREGKFNYQMKEKRIIGGHKRKLMLITSSPDDCTGNDTFPVDVVSIRQYVEPQKLTVQLPNTETKGFILNPCCKWLHTTSSKTVLTAITVYEDA